MPKYIRTVDGRIIDTEKEYQPLQWAEQARDYALTIAQADNLAELCDVIVETKGHTGEWIHYQYTNFNEPMKKRFT